MTEEQWENQLRLAQAQAYSNGYAAALEYVLSEVSRLHVEHGAGDQTDHGCLSEEEHRALIRVEAHIDALRTRGTRGLSDG